MTVYILKDAAGAMVEINGFGDILWTRNVDKAFWFLSRSDAVWFLGKHCDAGVAVEPVTVS